MASKDELKKIKKLYGERFMHLCRELFPTLLEEEGKLYEILSSTFSENCRTLYADIVNAGLEDKLKDFIYGKVNQESAKEDNISEKTPYELLEEAGYTLVECKTEEEIQSFKKYYAEGEELCTFRGGRLDRCIVFWAVRKDVEDIKREAFNDPKREDEYGTSVMSIQFNRKGKCTVSIKNRYNHRVGNPDATYGNDLNRIIPGLTESFERLLLKEKGIKLNDTNVEKLSIPGYVVANDGKYYKYNMEVNGNYYCPGNIVIKRGEVTQIENPESQILIDYFILDTKNKEIYPYDKTVQDGFVDALQDIERIEIRKSSGEGNKIRVITITLKGQDEPVTVEINEDNQIVGYQNDVLPYAKKNFLQHNRGLSKLWIPNVIEVGKCFLEDNKALRKVELPNLVLVGDHFLSQNTGITEFEAPKVTEIGDAFLYNNEALTKIELPELTKTGENFLERNDGIEQAILPNLVQAGSGFLHCNKGITELDLPRLEEVGNYFLYLNIRLRNLKAPNLSKVGRYFLTHNEEMTELDLPSLIEAGDRFMAGNEKLTDLKLPLLTEVGEEFLQGNLGLTEVEFPKLEITGGFFLAFNKNISSFKAPKLVKTGSSFLKRNQELVELELPSLGIVGFEFLEKNRKLTKLELPLMPELREGFQSIIDRNLENENNKKGKFRARDIAGLDKSQELTTSEIGFGRKILNRIVNLFKGRNSER